MKCERYNRTGEGAHPPCGVMWCGICCHRLLCFALLARIVIAFCFSLHRPVHVRAHVHTRTHACLCRFKHSGNKIILPETNLLLLKFAGSAAHVEADIATVKQLCERMSPRVGPFHFTRSEEESEDLWTVRKNCAWAASQYRNNTDVQVK